MHESSRIRTQPLKTLLVVPQLTCVGRRAHLVLNHHDVTPAFGVTSVDPHVRPGVVERSLRLDVGGLHVAPNQMAGIRRAQLRIPIQHRRKGLGEPVLPRLSAIR